ncbi:aminotransferase class I/II-fold pyridoxal phosphate-dependent enzyme [Massilia arenae]|uniref:DegT/DnrJ/EryC1/StrS aminotransferase family protein n=1 Tax=Massilia arenae TaxID=2603288 RepID=A0A5C7FU68_9BURK|nr:aminotransferase class I/II-fold pyridoxal phosphate-dependent enzyme [Massilia arenae]TXF99449.1 DegT/DnrJ/EryC1/StrS aminotransferase family protein [Massilia arenae]
MPRINNSTLPRRAIPSVPVLSLGAFGSRRAGLPALDDAPAVQLVTSGRIAIGMALRALGVGPGDTVLVPAYHSPSMIPPVHWCGAEVVFYRVHPDTTVDLDDVRRKMAPGVRAVMATHFFGFPQDLRALRALCDAHHAGLVEDCAHCFFGEHEGVAVGASGDYAIGSSMKFFPIFEGGCLVSHRHRLPDRLAGAGAGFEAKAALGALEASFGQGRLPALRLAAALPLHLKTVLWSRIKARAAGATVATAAPALAPSSSDSSFSFDSHWVDRRSSWFSRRVLRGADRARIVERRRRHYLELERALEGAPGWQPLFAALPQGACPWVFPLLAERPAALHERLRAAGVPMVRFGASLWPGVDAATCANSVALGRRLFGLPVHQELSPSERTWLAASVRAALAASMAAPA